MFGGMWEGIYEGMLESMLGVVVVGCARWCYFADILK